MREEKDTAHTRARVLADSSQDTHLRGEKSHGAQRGCRKSPKTTMIDGPPKQPRFCRCLRMLSLPRSTMRSARRLQCSRALMSNLIESRLISRLISCVDRLWTFSTVSTYYISGWPRSGAKRRCLVSPLHVKVGRLLTSLMAQKMNSSALIRGTVRSHGPQIRAGAIRKSWQGMLAQLIPLGPDSEADLS